MSTCDRGFAFEAMRADHDKEKGIPAHDDRIMFEHMMMETLQSGLSWSLMLKNPAIRKCMDHVK